MHEISEMAESRVDPAVRPKSRQLHRAKGWTADGAKAKGVVRRVTLRLFVRYAPVPSCFSQLHVLSVPKRAQGSTAGLDWVRGSFGARERTVGGGVS